VRILLIIFKVTIAKDGCRMVDRSFSIAPRDLSIVPTEYIRQYAPYILHLRAHTTAMCVSDKRVVQQVASLLDPLCYRGRKVAAIR